MGKIIKIKPNDLHFDGRYQRDVDEARADSYAQNLRLDLIGVPVASLRPNGKYFVIDGQHRVTALKIAGRGDAPISVEVYENLSVENEAAMFHLINKNRKPVNAWDDFKSRRAAKDPRALEIVDSMSGIGLHFSKTKARHGVSAITAVERAHAKGVLSKVMVTLTKWGNGDPDAYDGELIRAVAEFLVEYPDVDTADLASRLKPHDPVIVRRKLKSQKKVLDCTPSTAARVFFRDIYNARRSRERRLPPPGHK